MRKLALLIILGCSVLANAQSGPVTSSYVDFSGGLNNFVASIYLQKNESPDLMNVVIDEPLGKLVQRKGYTTCGNTPSGETATNLYAYNKQSGARYLIVTDNETVWQTDDCIDFTQIVTGLSTTDIPRFSTVIDNLWIVNGSTYPIVWNGTTASRLDGIGGMPSAPKAKYIGWWKSRVFLANTTTDPSGVYFSSLVSTAGAVNDPATSPAAWTNINNLIYFSRDDGSPIYGLILYRDNMYVFKDTGILRLVFQDEYTLGGINVAKMVSVTGSKFQESLVEMDDGLLRFVGKDGVYSFNGSAVKRISDKWTPTFYTIIQPGQGSANRVWDSANDYTAGTIVNLSTYTKGYDNKLALLTTPVTNWSVESSTTNWTLSGIASQVSTSALDLGGQVYGTTVTAIIAGGSYLMEMDKEVPVAYGGRAGFTISVINDAGATMVSKQYFTEEQDKYKTGYRDSLSLVGITGKVRLRIQEYTNAGNIYSKYFNAESMPGSNIPFAYAIGNQWVYGTGPFPPLLHVYTKVRIDFPTISTETPRVFYPLSGTFESEAIEATGLTQWRMFDTVDNANGKTLDYTAKVASTSFNLGTTAFTAISPGNTVSASTNTWFKWHADLSTNDEAISPSIDRVGVSWVTGDQTKSAIVAANYQSRYWVASATDTSNEYNTMTMVESKTPMGSFTRFDLPISAMAVWKNKLYGSIGNTDKIVQLDTGETDDSATINSYWDSKDEIYTSPVVYKSINKMIVDFETTPDNDSIQVGISNDLGQTWQYKALDTGVAGLARFTKILNPDANRKLQFRSRILNSKPGIGYTILGISTFGSETNFVGNY